MYSGMLCVSVSELELVTELSVLELVTELSVDEYGGVALGPRGFGLRKLRKTLGVSSLAVDVELR
jgi:hypothetical protein